MRPFCSGPPPPLRPRRRQSTLNCGGCEGERLCLQRPCHDLKCFVYSQAPPMAAANRERGRRLPVVAAKREKILQSPGGGLQKDESAIVLQKEGTAARPGGLRGGGAGNEAGGELRAAPVRVAACPPPVASGAEEADGEKLGRRACKRERRIKPKENKRLARRSDLGRGVPRGVCSVRGCPGSSQPAP